MLKKNNSLFFSIHFFSFIENKFLNFESKSKIKIKKFSVLKSPFKHNKSNESFFIKNHFNTVNLHILSPKIFELIFYKYLFLSNIKFLNIKKKRIYERFSNKIDLCFEDT